MKFIKLVAIAALSTFALTAAQAAPLVAPSTSIAPDSVIELVQAKKKVAKKKVAKKKVAKKKAAKKSGKKSKKAAKGKKVAKAGSCGTYAFYSKKAKKCVDKRG